jgi:hypothetical protein
MYTDPELECARELSDALRKIRETLNDKAVHRTLMWCLERYGVRVSTLLIIEKYMAPTAAPFTAISAHEEPVAELLNLPTATPVLIKDRNITCPKCGKNGFARIQGMAGHFFHAHGQRLNDWKAEHAD